MWICFNDGFVSIVKDKLNINDFVVRSRRKQILEDIFPDKEITILKFSDYKYRIYCSRSELCTILMDRVNSLDYTNFKNSVKDAELKHLYGTFWNDHYNYQK